MPSTKPIKSKRMTKKNRPQACHTTSLMSPATARCASTISKSNRTKASLLQPNKTIVFHLCKWTGVCSLMTSRPSRKGSSFTASLFSRKLAHMILSSLEISICRKTPRRLVKWMIRDRTTWTLSHLVINKSKPLILMPPPDRTTTPRWWNSQGRPAPARSRRRIAQAIGPARRSWPLKTTPAVAKDARFSDQITFAFGLLAPLKIT